ncbi:Thioesterase/thiol ester dehydrase-isomerase [Astrocystis sublimbata]|nr:Thioesterase/thiol ester dehydrase-isomerase [Astrocystis sublimbata]
MPSVIESHIAVTSTRPLETNVFANTEDFTTQPSGRAVFGGLLLSQAMMAACETVPSRLAPYSSYSTFLRPVTVKAGEKVAYHVEELANGANSATPRDESVLTYNIPMPDLDGLSPEDIGKDLNQQLLSSLAGSNQLWQFMTSEEDPFDWRPFGFVQAEDPWDSRIRAFVRSPTLATRSSAVHMAALAYLSDEILLGVPIFANPQQVGYQTENVTMGATLNHTITFHDTDVKVDEWHVVERQTSCAAEGRALILERVWGLESGRLIMTCTQEAAIRLKGASSKL